MAKMNYLQWLASETQTKWWHDSANIDEIERALNWGALGVTTNPVLTYRTLQAMPAFWDPMVKDIPEELAFERRAEAHLEKVATYVAKMLEPIYRKTDGTDGYTCGQLNPLKAGDAEGMLEMAGRVHEWAPNVAVKLPSTKAGLEVIEQLAAEGYTICATINFSVSQAVAVAERFRKGIEHAKKAGIKPGQCFAVQQVGRLDDYIRDINKERSTNITESDILQAGTAIAKRSYQIYRERGYEAIIMPAGLRGTYHLTELAGARMTFSLHPMLQDLVIEADLPFEERIDIPVSEDVIERLMAIPDFRKAYEINGLPEEEFITFGVAQRTISQFVWTGWYPLETYGCKKVSKRWT